ncbi:MAG: hypothetical protein EOP38_27540 [Rubrivivax sp.]|nr:MAG: hypothetical protein EOP38_27540 [Rubrivivax sp.]
MIADLGTRTVFMDEAAADSVLAEAVLDEQGKVLLGVGTVLTTALIESLDRRGVPCVTVECAGADSAVDIETRRQQARHAIEALFRHSLRHGQINPLIHLITHYRMDHLK